MEMFCLRVLSESVLVNEFSVLSVISEIVITLVSLYYHYHSQSLRRPQLLNYIFILVLIIFFIGVTTARRMEG